jgi:hypothetical protein
MRRIRLAGHLAAESASADTLFPLQVDCVAKVVLHWGSKILRATAAAFA